MRKLSILAAAVSVALFAGCQQTTTSEAPQAQVQQQVVQSEVEKANALFEESFNRSVMRSPIYQTYMGIKKDYDKWDDNSEARQLEDLELTKKDLAALNAIDRSKLDASTQVSYDLFKQNLETEIADFKWRYHNYPVNQMFGMHSMVPAFLINQHQIASVDDAKAYISRLNGVPKKYLISLSLACKSAQIKALLLLSLFSLMRSSPVKTSLKARRLLKAMTLPYWLTSNVK